MLTDAAVEAAAEALALSANGGDWSKDYTPEQQALWRKRVVAAMAVN